VSFVGPRAVDFVITVEFKAVMVLPEITRNYSDYSYGNYVGNALIGKVITLKTQKLRIFCSRL